MAYEKGNEFISDTQRSIVSVHRAPHLLCCRALEVRKYVCAPDALHLRHPVNGYEAFIKQRNQMETRGRNEIQL